MQKVITVEAIGAAHSTKIGWEYSDINELINKGFEVQNVVAFQDNNVSYLTFVLDTTHVLPKDLHSING